jgi:hypothetical protein
VIKVTFFTLDSFYILAYILPNTIITIVTGVLSVVVANYILQNKDLLKREKKKYIKFLRYNSYSLSKAFEKFDNYNKSTSQKYSILAVGTLISLFFGIFFVLLSSVFIIELLKRGYLTQDSSFLDSLYGSNTDQIKLNQSRIIYSSFLSLYALITCIFIICWIKLLKFKGYIDPKIKENLSITTLSTCVYYSYWLLEGALFSIDYIIIVLTFPAINELYSLHQNFSLIPIDWGIFLLFLLLATIIISIPTLFSLFKHIKDFNNKVKNCINNYYRPYFPYLRLKTEYGDIEGQIEDLSNNSFLVLGEENERKAVPWNYIKTMIKIEGDLIIKNNTGQIAIGSEINQEKNP